MIIFINGSINSGKSTVSKLLAEKLEKAAVIEIDELRHFIHWMPLDDAIPVNLENACLLIKNFAKHCLNVVVPYPLSQQNYEFFQDELKDVDVDKYFFTLCPSLEEVLKNRGKRKLTDWETDRIRHHYKIGINKPKFGVVIDNSRQTPVETTSEILSHVQVY